MRAAPVRTRLAPSPTGALHLGNARSFLLAWLWARSRGGEVVLRVEDLDGPRVKRGAVEQALDDLRWLGLDWDGAPLLQSTRAAAYAEALARLRAAGRVYPCTCSRSEATAAASAPNEGDEGPAYPGTCRGRWPSPEAARAATGREACWRFVVPEGERPYDDEVKGRVARAPLRDAGDFVVFKATGEAAYQLAVVLDDAHQGVTHVIRGDDLVPSTPRQVLLDEALGLPVPRFAHLPLVRGADGRRLAKRHGDTRLAAYREAGVPAARVVALLARWSGLGVEGEAAVTPGALRDRLAAEGGLAWSCVPAADVVFGPADDRWLRGPGR